MESVLLHEWKNLILSAWKEGSWNVKSAGGEAGDMKRRKDIRAYPKPLKFIVPSANIISER
jgi:hypothetical protein